MTDENTVNYPDLLGAITGGARLNSDVIQCALAVRPAQVHAGQFFDLVLVLQNAADIDVDVIVTPDLPARDAAKHKNRFSTHTKRIRIGLQAAEVGFLTMPLGSSPKTAPAPGYTLGAKLDIKRMGKRSQRIRAAKGGGAFVFDELPPDAQDHIERLRALSFATANSGKRHYVQAPFEVLPPALARLKKNLEPEWVSLWTMRDYRDDYVIADKVWDQVQTVLPQLQRDNVFMPLLKSTQEHFAACGYKLHPPEAIFITKLLTLLLEMGITKPTPDDPKPAWPRWFTTLCRALVRDPNLANQVPLLAARPLYADLVYDAIMYAFTMVSTVADEEFGDDEEASHYADSIVDTLVEQQRLDFARTYFPMVLGGLIANTRVTMPREQVRETVFVLSKALDQRQSERNADNAFIFDLTTRLIERALDAS